ncbi:MAG: hypothetical protein P1U61_06795 [Legionellaceae bacterium]|nr:hypothetical protein [Legionellaceae bacterium]
MQFKIKGLIGVICAAVSSFHVEAAVVSSSPAPNFPTSLELKDGHAVVQLGGFWSTQGQAQNIPIQGLIGNRYTVTQHNPSNGLVGIGYFLDSPEQVAFKHPFQLAYGFNLFYLGPTNVNGYIFEEQRSRNLAYSYQINQMPLYLAAKANIQTNHQKYNITLDGGVGPNFMRTSGYHETALNSYTLPSNSFTSHANVTFTATAGAGLRFNEFFGQAPFELGYRFFYLGQGQLTMNNDQLINPLKTGSIYANAIVCSITI